MCSGPGPRTQDQITVVTTAVTVRVRACDIWCSDPSVAHWHPKLADKTRITKN